MRIRTLAALVTGAAIGAGGVWLFDPETGRQRRRDALRTAWERGREVDWVSVAQRTGDAAAEIGRRAAEGYREGVRTPAGPS